MMRYHTLKGATANGVGGDWASVQCPRCKRPISVQTGEIRAEAKEQMFDVVMTDSLCILVSKTVRDSLVASGICGLSFIPATLNGEAYWQLNGDKWASVVEDRVLREKMCGCVKRMASEPLVITPPKDDSVSGALQLVEDPPRTLVREDVWELLRGFRHQLEAVQVHYDGEPDLPPNDLDQEPPWMKFMKRQ